MTIFTLLYLQAAEHARLELTAINTKLNAASGFQRKKKPRQSANKQKAKMSIQQAFAEEERYKRRQERLQKGSYSTIRDRRPIVKSLEEEDIHFAQLTRPSRNLVFYSLDHQLKERVLLGELIVFLIRPIKTKESKWPIPESLTEAQLIWSLEQVGVCRGFIGRLPGSVVEFVVVVYTKDVRNVPTKDDPLLRMDPVKAHAKFQTSIAPLLVERIDGRTITPSHLLFYDQSLTTAQHYKELPQHALARNAVHSNHNKRLVKAITDARFNVISIRGRSDQKLPFEKSAHLKSREIYQDFNPEIGLLPYWSNVVIDWNNLYYNSETDLQNLLETDLIQIQDDKLQQDKQPRILQLHKSTCSEGCFAESQICHDSTSHCRFLKWKLPTFECSFKPA